MKNQSKYCVALAVEYRPQKWNRIKTGKIDPIVRYQKKKK